MILKLTVEYLTSWGEELVLRIGKKTYPMSYIEDGLWGIEVKRFDPAKANEYRYELHRDGRCVRKEWRAHTISLSKVSNPKVLSIEDRWNDRPEDAPFYSSAFTKGIFGRNDCKPQELSFKTNAQIKVHLATVRPNEVLAIAGAGNGLGNWDKFVPLSGCDFPDWLQDFEVVEPFVYKYVIINEKTGEPILWEYGDNRFFATVPAKDEVIVLANDAPRFGNRWWKGAGTAIPVFSLRTEEGFGVGEFLDLKKMVDWAAETGQSVLQLLPINDTTMTGTWQDSYPYNANSTFALHPQFINLEAAGLKPDEEFEALKKELNALPQIDYERVNNEKTRLLRQVFARVRLGARKDYQEFLKSNSHWLLPYAAFCTLRDEFGTTDFSQWKGYSVYKKSKIDAYIEKNKKEIDYHCFVQYELDKQLSEVCKYAHSKGVILKGDLPIGISRTSADAWLYPELFHMDSQAGAPPDAFSEDGQNWGFPTYNWEKMAEDDYAWWKARLAKMGEYFDAFRIDHILGFFRIWQIPVGFESGLDGYFNPALPYPAQVLWDKGFNPKDTSLFIEDPHNKEHYHPRIGALKTNTFDKIDWVQKGAFEELYNDFFYHRHNEFWKQSALKKLPALLDSTQMLACGEDLGMIPATVPEVMAQLRILSLEIQRMPKSVTETFAHPANYPYLSVCTTSTHDMNPLRAWWEEDAHLSRRFFHEIVGERGPAPYFCEPWLCEKVLLQHLYSPAMFTILPLQDWLSMDGELRYQGNPADERINVPANSRHYWRYRMHISIEELLKQKLFNDKVTRMIHDSGR